jgi:hypothetical protein
MPGVCSALISYDYICVFTQKVNYFPFSLITPLGAEDDPNGAIRDFK